jgi:hypothetical protein
MSDHIMDDNFHCQWGPCNYKTSNLTDLHAHLVIEHGVFTQMTIPTRAKFCIECGVWISSDLDWERHVVQHARSPNIIHGPVTAEGILATPRRCLYCMMQDRFVQMENAGHYAEHIEDHINRQFDKGCRKCPHYSCTGQDFTKKELRDHFNAVHGIALP